MIKYTEVNQILGRVTSVFVINIKGVFKNVHKSVFLKTISDLNLPEVSRCLVNYFLSR